MRPLRRPARLAALAPVALVLVALAPACRDAEPDLGPTARWAAGDALLGRWEKPEATLPPISLEIRREPTGALLGRVALSGVVHDAPVSADEASFTLGAGRPTMRGALTREGTLRVQLLGPGGETAHEAVLVRTR